jgi:HK97 family phage prohead protease
VAVHAAAPIIPAAVRVDRLESDLVSAADEARLMEFAGSPFEIKALNDSGHIEGLLAGFGNVDSHGDRIASTAFTKTLAARGSQPLPMLLHHDLKRPVGAWKSWQERADGLFVEGALTLATRDAQEAYALAKAGALTGLSIGFHNPKRRVDQRTGAVDLLELELIEGSLVTVPSNPATYVSAIKSITGARDIAEMLQDAGISGRRAKAAAGAAWKAINEQSDEATADAELAALIQNATARLAKGGR